MNSRTGRAISKQGGQGFTLVELLVTIAVLTIIIAMGVPMYGQFTQGSAISSRSSELVSAMNYARSEAVGRRVVIRVAAIGGSWDNGWEIHDDSLALMNPPQATLLRTVNLSTSDVGIDITEANGLLAFTYDRQGRISAPTPAFTLCPGGGGDGPGRVFAISRFGRIEITVVQSPGPECP